MPKPYIAKDHCTKCHKPLTSHEKMYSNGCCPHCGDTNHSTIVNTYQVVYQLDPNHRWWKRPKYIKKPSSL